MIACECKDVRKRPRYLAPRLQVRSLLLKEKRHQSDQLLVSQRFCRSQKIGTYFPSPLQ